jgi:hypothetical protein
VSRGDGWLSRAAVRWGPRFCSTAPGRIPRPSPHSFPSWAGQVEDVEKAAVDGEAVAFQRAGRMGIGTPYNGCYAG